MANIYLHQVGVSMKYRVDPDEILTMEPRKNAVGSVVVFKNKECMIYTETPQQIERKEWQMRYLWPNIERFIVALLGGVVGALITLLSKGALHLGDL